MSAISYPQTREKQLLAQGLRALFTAAVLFLLALLLSFAAFQIYYANRVYPGVSIAGIDLSGLTAREAAIKVGTQFTYPRTGQIQLTDGDRAWSATPTQVGYTIDLDATIERAYSVGRGDLFLTNWLNQAHAWLNSVDLPPVMIYDQRVGSAFLAEIAKEVDVPVLEADLSLQGAEVVVNSGRVGRTLDQNATLHLLGVNFQTFQDGVVPLFIRESPPLILDASQQAELARQILSAPLTLTIPNPQEGDPGPWTFDQNTLASMLTIERLQSPTGANYQVVINSDLLRNYLNGLAPTLARSPQNPRFTFNDDTRQLEVIQNAVFGRSLDVEASIQAINTQLGQGQHEIQLVFQEEKPAVTDDMTGEQLGITELVHEETSYFRGSGPARVQNITTASSRFHGVLVAPGETFSMANALGDISLDNGYAEALIIYGNSTIKGVGGGVCQVSTTLFRGVFFAGYPIAERHAHAYRVSYYEQKASGGIDPNLAGLDATVFVPLVDFKFVNDTPYWLLMETYVTNGSLTWKFYSTSDGRTVEWNTSGLTSVTEPEEPLYRENPDLGQGTKKQVEWATNGADVSISRTVYRDGSVYLQDQFNTHYVPWREVWEYGPGTEGIPTPEATSSE